MITVHQLSKKYNNVEVLNLEKLDIPKGQSFGLVGNNGAGKTTFFSLLLDLIQPSSGYIKNNDILVHESEAWKPFTSSFIDESFLIGYLTAEEYFYFIGELRNQNKADVDKLLSNFTDFFHDEILGKKKYLRDLSKGNQKKAGIVAALIGNPEVIILDEPTAALGVKESRKVLELIQDVKSRGIPIILISHNMPHVFEVADRIHIHRLGKRLCVINPKDYTMSDAVAFMTGAKEAPTIEVLT